MWDLFITFFKMGAVTFGGGYAMLPILEKEIVENKKWANMDEIMEYYAIGQATPGIIALNTSTFIGYKILGLKGAISAVLGFITPSLVIIILLANVLENLVAYPYYSNILQGIRISVLALVFNSVIHLLSKIKWNRLNLIIFIIAFISGFFFKLSPVIIIFTVLLSLYIVFILGGKSKT